VLGEPDDAQLVAEVVVAQLRVPVQNRRDSVGKAGPGQPDGSTSPMTRSTTTSSPIFTTARGRRGRGGERRPPAARRIPAWLLYDVEKGVANRIVLGVAAMHMTRRSRR
jgi:hypothetical protein